MQPRREGGGVRARSGDGDRERREQPWSASLCGNSCCLGLGGMEAAVPFCEKREAHEDLLLAVEASLGMGDGVLLVAETSSRISGKSPRRGEKGVSASSSGVVGTGVVLYVRQSSPDGGPVEVIEFEFCDDPRVIVRGALLLVVARRGLPVRVAAAAALEALQSRGAELSPASAPSYATSGGCPAPSWR
ncbi:hypothetical protein MRX96_018134 [Rhipicephalus microplus]